MTIHFVLQVISFALIAHVFRTDERFETKGSHLGMSLRFPSFMQNSEADKTDKSFTFGVLAAATSGLTVLFLTYTAYAASKSYIPSDEQGITDV
jgi:hypothetical protein